MLGTYCHSDGSILQWISFIKPLQAGNRAFFSLNEGDNRAQYPYFLIGLIQTVDPVTNEKVLKPVGEASARRF